MTRNVDVLKLGKVVSELTDDELKEILLDLSGRPYLTESESQRFTEAVDEADARWQWRGKSA